MMSDGKPQVLCYLCAIIDEKIEVERLIDFPNPAATNKVLGICSAMLPHLRRVYVVSTGRCGGAYDGSRFSATVRRVSNVTVMYGAFWKIPLVTHVVTSLSLVGLLFRLMKRSDSDRVCLIAYNRKCHYLPMLVMARLFGVRCYLDLEDGALVKTGTISHRLNAPIMRWLFDHLCNQGAMLASSLLSHQVGHKRQLVCHGVVSLRKLPKTGQAKNALPVQVLYGGTLNKSTGAQLLMNCVRLLEKHHQDVKQRVQIVVTGYGDMSDDLKRFALDEGKDWIEYYGEVDGEVYRSLLDASQIGLCLKLPSSEVCATTFPSKVLEFASYGKAVMTTGIEDVVRLFGEDGAYILDDESVNSLVNMMRKVALEPDGIYGVAERGRGRLVQRAGKDAVAHNIMNLLIEERVLSK